MRKLKTITLVLGIVLTMCLSGCGCSHEWEEASCEVPKTCSLCGETEGEALGHAWAEATCEAPSTCDGCGNTQGEALGHEWVDATCEAAKICSRCKETEGEALGHVLGDATIVKEPTCVEVGVEESVCEVCGKTVSQDIPVIEHKMGKATVTVKATCTTEGTKEQVCSECGETVTEAIPATGHKEGKWVVITKATYNTAGQRAINCTVCKAELKNESYELTAEEKEADYKRTCKKYSYKEISRNPDSYSGELAKFTGRVLQVQQQEMYGMMVYVLRVGTAGYSDVVYVTYYASANSKRILEDDRITMYGELTGTKTYTTVMGASITIPSFTAEYIDIR